MCYRKLFYLISTMQSFKSYLRITNQISICCIFLVTGIQLLFAHPENHVEIWLVILFLSRKKFHAKQIFVLSSTMKLGHGLKIHYICFIRNIFYKSRVFKFAFKTLLSLFQNTNFHVKVSQEKKKSPVT